MNTYPPLSRVENLELQCQALQAGNDALLAEVARLRGENFSLIQGYTHLRMQVAIWEARHGPLLVRDELLDEIELSD